MKCSTYKYWTNHEIKILKELYHTHGATKLATILNRSVDAVRQAAGKHGVKARKSLYKPPINYKRHLENESCNSSN